VAVYDYLVLLATKLANSCSHVIPRFVLPLGWEAFFYSLIEWLSVTAAETKLQHAGGSRLLIFCDSLGF
jgi:hypothetical protein